MCKKRGVGIDLLFCYLLLSPNGCCCWCLVSVSCCAKVSVVSETETSISASFISFYSVVDVLVCGWLQSNELLLLLLLVLLLFFFFPFLESHLFHTSTIKKTHWTRRNAQYFTDVYITSRTRWGESEDGTGRSLTARLGAQTEETNSWASRRLQQCPRRQRHLATISFVTALLIEPVCLCWAQMMMMSFCI